MKRFTLILFAAMGSLTAIAGAQEPMKNIRWYFDQIKQLQDEGKLTEADEMARQTLEDYRASAPPEQLEAMEFELERSRRIRQDYSLTEKELLQMLNESIQDFNKAEFEQWEKEGRFDVLTIDGEKRYVGASRSNLFFRYPDLRARKIKKGDAEFEQFLLKHIREIKSHYRQAAQSTVLSKDFRMHMTITVKPNEVPPGQTIRCWMPYPQQFEAQSGVRLLASTPEVSWMNAPRYPMRSLYFEQPSKGERETVFQADYEMTTWARYNPIDPAKILPINRRHPYWGYFMAETTDHVAFTPEIQDLGRKIVQGERNPYLKARRIYDWMSKNIQYSYAREYSTLRNISLYTIQHRYGDCGQQALLFIALCRSQGIPARWQSGWMIYPPLKNLHDWSEIYLEPYGWIPVDVNFAQMVEQDFESLNRDEREELKEFYFGGLDNYRLVVNSIHGYDHFPPKESFRSDTVDFQRGELESNGENIYFDRFRYRLDVEYLDAADAPAPLEGEAGPTAPGLAR